MKCGLLPLCHEAMALGEVAYSEYTGGGQDDTANIRQALAGNAKVRVGRPLSSLPNCQPFSVNSQLGNLFHPLYSMHYTVHHKKYFTDTLCGKFAIK